MTQFDVFPNPVTSSRRAYPFVICLQSALAPRRALADAGRLAPSVRIDDDEYAVLVTSITTLPAQDLSRRVANLARHGEAILDAIDLVFYGV